VSDVRDIDPDRFAIKRFEGRGFRQAFVHEGIGGVPLLLVHGWPETKRIWWRVIEPLAAAGFEVIVPDLRGFGDSDVGPDGFHDVHAHVHDLHALVVNGLGHDRMVLAGGDLGGPVIQAMAHEWPDLVDRMVLFNAPVPVPAGDDRYGGIALSSAHDYFLRQGTDADALAAELASPEQRERYIATFYSSRFWAHDGAFDPAAIAFHVAPFADATKLRASFGAYESAFDKDKRSGRVSIRANPDVSVLILYGEADHVIPKGFDEHAAEAFPDHVGPFLLRDCGHFVPWEAAHAFITGTTVFCGDRLATHRRP
jgi:pimeloyl-ACP methyl ester carboxylesterase